MKRGRSRDPRTPVEWQDAVNAAEFFTFVDSAKQYGLLEGGPTVNADRCYDILERGKLRGILSLPFDELCEIYRHLFADDGHTGEAGATISNEPFPSNALSRRSGNA